jgi:hypothetical protein
MRPNAQSTAKTILSHLRHLALQRPFWPQLFIHLMDFSKCFFFGSGCEVALTDSAWPAHVHQVDTWFICAWPGHVYQGDNCSSVLGWFMCIE